MSSQILHSLSLNPALGAMPRRVGLVRALGDWMTARNGRVALSRLDDRLRQDVGLPARRPDLPCLPPLFPGF